MTLAEARAPRLALLANTRNADGDLRVWTPFKPQVPEKEGIGPEKCLSARMRGGSVAGAVSRNRHIKPSCHQTRTQ